MLDRRSALLWLVIVLGVVGRAAAVGWNDLPHGDVHLDLQTVHALAAGEGLRTPLERTIELYPPVDALPGHPLDQHPPLVSLLAAPLVPLAGDAYGALQLVSLLAGLLAIAAAAWSATRLFGRESALWAAAFVAGSYALLDFAGNGSIYALQTALVLTVPGLMTFRAGGPLAGAVCALAWLTNYQAAVYAVAVVLAPLVARGRRGVGSSVLAALGFAAVALPWWVRNFDVFGDPFFSVNPLYLRARFGAVPTLIENGGPLRLALEGPTLGALAVALAKNLVVNVRFVATQSPLWLGPLLFAGIAGAWSVLNRGRRERSAALVVLVLLPVLHVVTMLAWPACKFRYLVPFAALAVLPTLAAFRDPDRAGTWRTVRWVGLVVALAALERLLRGGARDGVIVLAALGVGLWAVRGMNPGRALVVFVALQIGLGWAAGPTRSTYYDGILVANVFGRIDEEASNRARQRELAAFAERLALPEGTAVVSDVALASHARGIRVVQPPPIDDPAVRRRCFIDLRRRFGTFYVLVEGESDERALREVAPLAASPVTEHGRFRLFRVAP